MWLRVISCPALTHSIALQAPRDPADNAINRWIKKNSVNPASPIFHFTKQEILDAIKSNKNQGEHASTQHQYQLTLLDVADWVKKHLYQVLQKLDLYSLTMLGIKKKGKTSLACIIAMSISRFRISCGGKDMQAGFRLTQDLDFIKDHAGEVEIPIIYDDGDLFELGPKCLKALFDQKAVEAKTKERYTSTKMQMGQLRIACDNPIDEKVEVSETMSDIKFMELIQPSFSRRMSRSNFEAVMERSIFMVNTTAKLVIRFPMDMEKRFVVVDWPLDGSYLAAGCVDILTEWSKTKVERPGLQEMIEQEQILLKNIIEGVLPELPIRIIPATPAGTEASQTVVSREVDGSYRIPCPVLAAATSNRRGLFHFGGGSASSGDAFADAPPALSSLDGAEASPLNPDLDPPSPLDPDELAKLLGVSDLPDATLEMEPDTVPELFEDEDAVMHAVKLESLFGDRVKEEPLSPIIIEDSD